MLFEQSILGILPAGAFLIAFPAALYPLTKSRPRTEHNLIRVLKTVVATLFVAIQVVLLVLWALHKNIQTKASIPLAAINLLVAIQLVALSWIEDVRSVKPSSLLNTYLLFTLLFDLVQVRTLWLQGIQTTSIPAAYTAAVALKTVFLLLEMLGKRRYLKPAYRDLPPESTSGVINRSVMWWINDLLWRGFRSLLTLQDLYSLDEDLNSAELGDKVQSIWHRREKPERSFEFPWKMCQAMRWSLASTVFPRLCLIGFTFSQPFLISAILKWVQQEDTNKNEGYGLIGATFLVYLGLAISTILYNHKLYRFITMFRGATVSLIYRHALLLQDNDLPDRSTAITLMGSDVDRISACLVNLNECWARSIEVVIGIIILAYQIGWVCVMPIAVVVVSSLGCIQVSKRIGGRQRIWIDAVQERIAITSSILTDMKSVRMMGLSWHFTKVIQGKRVTETHRMAGFRWSIVWQNAIQNLPWAMAPSLTFTIYAVLGNSMDPSRVFTSLSVITLLTNPAAKLFSAIPSTAASLGCFHRIQAFLTMQPNCSNPPAVNLSPTGSFETEKISKKFAVSMHGVHISPAMGTDFILRDVNIRILSKSLVVLCGPVASGKTTLLRMILGKSYHQNGSIFVAHDRVGYCSQVPWLPNTTIREAICGITDTDKRDGQHMDIQFYRTALQACALDDDIELLPQGDDTRIGSGSSAVLSGGQMHRVALARAIYSRSEMVLLDDILSALDPKTVRIITQRVFGKTGLFRKLGTTVVLVTRETALFSQADIVYTVSNGSVRKKQSDEQALDTEQPSSGNDVNEGKAQDREAALKRDAAQAAKDDRLHDLKRATGDWDIYKYYFQSIGWCKLSIFLTFVIVNVFCSTFSQIWLKWWADRGGDQRALFVSVYFVLAIFNSIGNGGYVWAMMVLISPSTARKLHYTLLRTVMRAPQSYLSATDNGIILNRFSQDMTLVEGQLAISLLITASNIFTSIATAALIATGSSYMAVTIPFLMIAVFILQHFYLRTSRQLRLLDLETKSPLYSHFLESVNGLTTIQAFGWQREFVEKNHRLLDNSQRPYYLLYCIQRWLSLALDLIVTSEAVILVCMAVTIRSSSSAGLLGVSLNNVLSFSNSLSSLISGWTQLEISLGSIARVKNFETQVTPEEIGNEKNEPSPNWPERGAISFHGVNASHSPGSAALQGISFDIQPGQKIGICGRTGSGKSSLLGTLLGILEVEEGRIFADRVDLNSIPRETIREKLVTIPQFPLVVSASSVRSNADPEGLQTDAKIIAALQRVRLWDKVKGQGGLDATSIISSLSRGEQQLFAVARALLKVQVKDSKIILLDEATSSIDPEAEQMVMQILREEPFASRTILMVTHSLTTILGCDIILVMEEGRIVEMGCPSDLLQKPNSNLSLLRGTGSHD
ncbi:ATP-binding cassette transporter, putative [Talaromyces stipitatus ATCC 10500]|uniref:ATP-binding cassette transporter, putative n=1 Tax=Talaromyces stipitatus (strain ATCC 10500 / CBS 375.48 / QM 6759 / NRRL 1006) TaxID=441959 RepID=B8MLQ7_TALSN|nr:ATP-binding cassette transporter, putative [Talaromyces stipitatus ATCC 10500]EED13629.1 ATP-binding cassette transporter, putative [Talaromyces stipitatus ATCC 10500]